jgi:hypothetical protein
VSSSRPNGGARRGRGNDLTVESPTGSDDIGKIKELYEATLSLPAQRTAPSVSPPPSFLNPLPAQTPGFEALFRAVNCESRKARYTLQ